MNKILKGILLVVICIMSMHNINAQNQIMAPDSIAINNIETIKRHYPNKATMFSAVLPGLGQIYNKQALKVPFIYGGFVGIGIYINKYNKLYNNYKKAYFELNDKNPKTTYYKTIEKIFKEENIDETNTSTYNSLLINDIESFNRNRDILIIGAVGFYLLNILDANVNGHFIDFDISEDLAFSFEPVAIDYYSNTPVFGISLKYNF